MQAEWYLALRFLREGRAQTALIIIGAATGVAVMVFITALITGLQETIIERTLGTQAHIVVRPPDEIVRELLASRSPGVVVASRIEEPAQRVQSIDQWQRVDRQLSRLGGVVAVSPMASGSAFAVRGNASRSVALIGIDAERYTRVVPIRDHLVEGRYSLAGTDALIGTELAGDLGVVLGGRVRVGTAEGRAQIFTVRGIFDLGIEDLNARWVVVSLRNAQTLLDLVGGASSIDLKVSDVFEADRVADRIEERTGLDAQSWMERNAELMVALRSQSASSTIIVVFVMIAVAMGIASVLIVSVVQRARQIGILRAMGAPRGRVLRIFLIQGGVVGVAGAILGSAIGAALAQLFTALVRDAEGEPLFPVALDAGIFASTLLIATATGVASAFFPARHASRLDPAVAIRHE